MCAVPTAKITASDQRAILITSDQLQTDNSYWLAWMSASQPAGGAGPSRTTPTANISGCFWRILWMWNIYLHRWSCWYWWSLCILIKCVVFFSFKTTSCTFIYCFLHTEHYHSQRLPVSLLLLWWWGWPRSGYIICPLNHWSTLMDCIANIYF